MAAESVSIVIFPALYMGLIIGLYELIAIHKDVGGYRGSHWLGHGIQSVIFVMIALFVTMNAAFVYDKLSFLQNIPLVQNQIVFQIAIGLLLLLKVHIVSAVVKGASGRGMKETWIHSLIVSGLVVAAPYVWPLLEPLVSSWLPGV